MNLKPVSGLAILPLITLFSLSAVVHKYLSKSGGRFYCLYVDFQKAFDKVEHKQLFKSLTKKGIHGKFLRAVCS